jgi:beta-N-acetylhexosaminidase
MIEVGALTDEQLAGQRLMVGFDGKEPDEKLRALIRGIHVGGLILFKRNISDRAQLRVLCQRAQAFAAEAGLPPLLIAIDQEGGPVARLGPPFTVFPGNRAMGKAGARDAAAEFGMVTARELKDVGINLNFAPVLDVVPEGMLASVMEDRIFGHSPALVAAFGRTVIENLQAGGVAATAKHFPGIGRTTLDSHVDLPFLDIGRSALDADDLVPFREAIACGVAAVMLSHIVYTDIDSKWPAGLSATIAKDILRDSMGFRGVSITDDLDMGAIDKHFDVDTFVQRICAAQVDIALICHDQEKMQTTYDALLQAVKGSEKTRRDTLASVQRIMQLKARYA